MAVSKIKQWLLTLSILAVLVFFVFYAISVFYEEPVWDQFCPQYPVKLVETQPDCESSGGMWNPQPDNVCPLGQKCPKGYCDVNYKCSREYESASKIYERNVFAMAMVLGAAFLIIGLILKGVATSTGIMGGGFIIMIFSLVRYWGNLSKYFRVALLAVILALLIWVGYTKVDRVKAEVSLKSRRKR